MKKRADGTLSRREFLQRASGATAALAVHPSVSAFATQPRGSTLDPSTLRPFLDPLPRLPLAKPSGLRMHDGRQIPAYRLAMRAIAHRVHRDVPPGTWWSFGARFPGPTIEARRGQPISVEWVNHLPAAHFLPIDHTLAGAGRDVPEVRTVVHLHGGRVPPESDGRPDGWHVPGQSHIDLYPNDQDAAALWYHDHAMGIHRLNMLAGLFGLYLVRDDDEDALKLPSGVHEIPLILCDRSFRRDGQQLYPISGVPGRPWVPEFFGNALLVNGALFPYLEVEPRRYRFRVLNASNGRFLNLTWPAGLPVHQIGTDQGLLRSPVSLPTLHLAPAERADLIVDFSANVADRVVLTNDGTEVLQFRVGSGRMRDDSRVPSTLRDVPVIGRSEAVRTRRLTLGEVDSMNGEPLRMLLDGKRWNAPVSETPALGSTEIWELVNVTDDAHPIHLHLVRFQILERQAFDVFEYETRRVVRPLGPPVPPDASEAGWKDTVRAAPGMVTRIIIRFEGYPGRYVWHCHLLEHGDNEMMRPLHVIRGG